MELLVRILMLHDVGFCLLDPHGDLTHNVLAFLFEERQRRAARGRPIDLSRTYLYEPFEPEVVGINPLDAGRANVYSHVTGLVGAFRRAFASAWGPHVETLTRNTLLTLSHAGRPVTDAPRLLTVPAFRAELLRQVADRSVAEYWLCRFDQLGDSQRRSLVESLLTKLEGGLIGDPRLRAMLSQTGTPEFRQLMDEGSWMLFNLSKGHLRESSTLLGSLVVAQLQTAALSRADLPEAKRRPFVLLADEFQNFQGDGFSTILSEARKYRLSLVLAHQATAQVEAELLASVFSNVATQVFFACSPQDAATVSRGFADGSVPAESLVHLPPGTAVFRRRGRPATRVRILPVHTPELDPVAFADFRQVLRKRHATEDGARDPQSADGRPDAEPLSSGQVREADDD